MPGEVVRAVVRFCNEHRLSHRILLMGTNKIDDAAPIVVVVMAGMAKIIAKEEDAIIKEKILVEDAGVEVISLHNKFLLARSCHWWNGLQVFIINI